MVHHRAFWCQGRHRDKATERAPKIPVAYTNIQEIKGSHAKPSSKASTINDAFSGENSNFCGVRVMMVINTCQ